MREIANDKYPNLSNYSKVVKAPARAIIGRERQIKRLLAIFENPELCNALLIGEPGVGKTALVQGCMMQDQNRFYLEVDLTKMLSDLSNPDEMAVRLKGLFEDARNYVVQEKVELVLFIDEFHQIITLSKAAVEALKPMLADSGTRNIRVVVATTYKEFRENVSPNQALVERLQRLNIPQPNKKTTIEILKGYASRYHVDHKFYNNYIFEQIYELTNRYIPANAQPRKSIIILDSMIGWHKFNNSKMDLKLLADVIYDSEGVNVAFRVDPKMIKDSLNKVVISQEFAVDTIENRLQLCVADLNDHSKPMSTFLFTGSTGVGKSAISKALAEVLFEDDRNLIRFDMTEYVNPESEERFRSELTAKIWERPYSIILLDEIEKACKEVTRLLLPVLDDGRLIDENNREVSFQNCYIIMTTNLGSEIYQMIGHYEVDDTGSGKKLKQYDKLIRSSLSKTGGSGKFPPELLGRIDCIVPFQPLSIETQRKILAIKIQALLKEIMRKHNVETIVDPRVSAYIIDNCVDSDSDSGGARALVHILETEVATAISRFINQFPDENKIFVTVEGILSSENKNIKDTDASIKVMKVV